MVNRTVLLNKLREMMDWVKPPGFSHSYIVALETIDRQRLEIARLRREVDMLRTWYNEER
jgi:hypothetical protein